MNRIFKFGLPMNKGEFELQIPEIQYTLHVEVVNNMPFMWAVVNPDKAVTYKIHVFWTGDVAPDMDHMLRIGTAVMGGGTYVCHYYREETR